MTKVRRNVFVWDQNFLFIFRISGRHMTDQREIIIGNGTILGFSCSHGNISIGITVTTNCASVVSIRSFAHEIGSRNYRIFLPTRNLIVSDGEGEVAHLFLSTAIIDDNFGDNQGTVFIAIIVWNIVIGNRANLCLALPYGDISIRITVTANRSSVLFVGSLT